MKRIIIVNNNMKIGGVQKSLCNLLWSVHDRYEITLLLFDQNGACLEDLPEDVKVSHVSSLYRYLGFSQGECRSLRDKLLRGGLAALCRWLGRPAVLRLMDLSQRTLSGSYDAAVSYLHSGDVRVFYGGTNEFVLRHIRAERKIAFLHGDYEQCGGNHPSNNRQYERFDRIAACSEGCRDAFLRVMPDLQDRCITVRNFHRYALLREMAGERTVSAAEEMALEISQESSIGPVRAVIVGRLAEEKAVDRAIRAVIYARSCGQEVLLDVIGDGYEREKLEMLVQEEHLQRQVSFLGERENPYPWIGEADLLLITSHHEAAPMVIDEALALGTPVLTVRTTSSEEMVAGTKGGWICENSQEALNTALVRITGQRELLAEKRRELMQRSFDNERAMKQFEALLGDFLD